MEGTHIRNPFTPYVNYGFHFTDFYETHTQAIWICECQYRISYKMDENCRKYGEKFVCALKSTGLSLF
jgi:hypothetical protein